MMDREWRAILARYGQWVYVYAPGRESGTAARAFLQPVLDRKEEQTKPTPLGQRRLDRLLYLGPREIPLAEGGRVERQKERYAVRTAHLVGDSHWWAVLEPQDKEEP